VSGGGRFLFVTWPGGGNISPLVALGVQLVERGHEVRVLADETLRGRFSDEGLGFEPQLQAGQLLGLADNVLAEIKREPVDVVVSDYMQPAALCAVELAGLPSVAFVHTLYSGVAKSPMSPMTVVSGGLDAVNSLRLELGLAPLVEVPDLLDQCALTMVVTAEEFDRPDGPVPQNVRYVGPIVERPGPDADWSPPWPSSDRPVVHACTSTIAPPETARAVLQRVLDALAEDDVTVFVTAQDDVRDGLRLPSNAYASGYVRHSVVLPRVDLFVTHAGLSSVAAALRCGAPMVCMPLMYEQPANAAHAEAVGVARTVATDAPVEEIRSVITSALTDDGMRERARQFAASLRTGEPSVAVSELEALLPDF
jgi:UDP:flavonoid glycosyltransferase YjiC (YdhE family)